MLIAARLQRILPFYYGWVVLGASGTAVFARMALGISTLTVFIYSMSQELSWSRTLIAGTGGGQGTAAPTLVGEG